MLFSVPNAAVVNIVELCEYAQYCADNVPPWYSISIQVPPCKCTFGFKHQQILDIQQQKEIALSSSLVPITQQTATAACYRVDTAVRTENA